MDGAKDGKFAPSKEGGAPVSAAPQTISMEAAMELLSRSSVAGAEKFSLAMERFSVLSTEMITLLMGLSQEIHQSAEELGAIRNAADLKKKELETLLEAEHSARALARQTEDLKREKEELEQYIRNQRASWEEERAQREKEVEEHRKDWDTEQFRARQELEEALRAIRQQNQEAHEAVEREWIDREQNLKNKELEWSQLIHELDQFLTKLAGRSGPCTVNPLLLREDVAVSSGSIVSGISRSGYFRDEDEADSPYDEALMWEKAWGEGAPAIGERNHAFEPDSAEDFRLSQAFMKDAHVLPNRRMDDSDSSPKRENAPLKFAPKNSSNHG